MIFPTDASNLPADYPVHHRSAVDDTLTQCDRCTIDCWISPEARTKMVQHKAHKLCPKCVDAVITANPSAIDIEMLHRQPGTRLRRGE